MDTLTHEQRAVLHELLNGHSVALLGAAGCGKSYLLSILYTEFGKLWASSHPYDETLKQIQMCALTGCAALLLGPHAKTVHSWAGIGLGKGTVDELCIKIRKNTRAKRNWVQTDLLIIDEISMMTTELLDKLNEIGKKMRKNEKPFGGIQLLLVGDFYQLPPVVREKSDEPLFAFESKTWQEAIHCAVELTVIQRQKDPVFQQVLMEARVGQFTAASCALLRSHQGLDWAAHKIRPTLLFPRRAEVDMINESNLKALLATSKERQVYKARIVYDPKKLMGGFSEKSEPFQRALAALDNDAAYSVELELVEDAQVMLIANVDPAVGLVNGSRGVIMGFCRATTHPIVEFVNGVRRVMGLHNWAIDGYPLVMRAQVPLRLSWANTIHKSQGASLDCALVDIGPNNFEYGQAYVALSRVRSLDALFVHDFDASAFRVHPRVKAFYNALVVCEVTAITVVTAVVAPVEELKKTEESKEERIEEPGAQMVVVRPMMEVAAVENPHVENVTVENPVENSPGNWLFDSIPAVWKDSLASQEKVLQALSTTLATKEFLPPRDQVWSALALTPLSTVKVVILGQDPYPTVGNAHGLAFSVLPTVNPIPASLKNIYKELAADLGWPVDKTGLPLHKKTGHLVSWAEQGVLLLNTVLTVEAGAPQSHAKLGWEPVTDHLLRTIAATRQHVVFVLWGKSAQAKRGAIALYEEKNGHLVLEAAHPSPLSASKGFLGSRPFSTVNAWLEKKGLAGVEW